MEPAGDDGKCLLHRGNVDHFLRGENLASPEGTEAFVETRGNVGRYRRARGEEPLYGKSREGQERDDGEKDENITDDDKAAFQYPSGGRFSQVPELRRAWAFGP